MHPTPNLILPADFFYHSQVVSHTPSLLKASDCQGRILYSGTIDFKQCQSLPDTLFCSFWQLFRRKFGTSLLVARSCQNWRLWVARSCQNWRLWVARSCQKWQLLSSQFIWQQLTSFITQPQSACSADCLKVAKFGSEFYHF